MSLIRLAQIVAVLSLVAGCATTAPPSTPDPIGSQSRPAVESEPALVVAREAPVRPDVPELPVVGSRPSLPEIAAAAPFDDAALRDRFTELVESLRESGSVVAPGVLREQLGSRTTCRLDMPAARDVPLTTTELFARGRPSTVLVGNVYDCGRCSRWHAGVASGFAIGPDVVATNHHVIANDKAAAFAVMSASGDVYPVTEVLAADKEGDAAIVRVAIPDGAEPLAPARVAAHAPVGARVAVISHPTDQFFTFTEGMVSRYFVFRARRSGPTSVRMAITADYARGSSGAPVFDVYGNVCGMVSSTRSVYYDRDKDGRDRNLQMVIRRCVPSATILALISGAPVPTHAP